ncbi:hypothetical protein CEXT_374321 [Caerostris extrusa]|uniref:Uncharacterized protein n=1 Tax=Caerostris extrusa TaxID=172846 RepID=A0AAV4W8Y5_CAEEX|nr:hypothetical protein CEXT_374321 [Caerostris extrusa]
MDTENSTAMPERKKQMPPFFITPNASWPGTCKVLTSTGESLNISLSKGQFLKLTVNSERDYETPQINPDQEKCTLQMLQSEEAHPSKGSD